MGQGAVAAGHTETVKAASDILQAGGNAFDAALAAMTVACVAEPVLASLGGGGFLLARKADAPDAPVLYDFFAQTPRKRKPAEAIEFFPIMADFGTTTQEFHVGAGAIATPGVVPGLFAIHGDLCRLPLREILQPACTLAREGVQVNDFQAYLFGVVDSIFSHTPESLACFGSVKGGLAKSGDSLKNTGLADVFDALSREGEVLFREGDIARAICDLCAEHGAHLGADDLRSYQVERRKPLDVNYRGAKIITNPGPSTGGVLIGFALRILEKAGLSSFAGKGPDHYQMLIRAMDATNRARIESGLDLGKPDTLLDEKFLSHYIDRVHGRPSAHRGTTHISIIDGQGNAAALTMSNGEGCTHMVPGAGFMLNNMLGEEDINPFGFNNWPEDTRLCSMMAPSMIEHSDQSLSVLGSGGSNRIRTALLQVILNILDQDMSLIDAVEAPRIHYENNILNAEPFPNPDILKLLSAEHLDSHLWKDQNMFFGGVHAVSRSVAVDAGKEYQACGDTRRDGASILLDTCF